ncbi:uncharacterized protein [Bemisia tabaci]
MEAVSSLNDDILEKEKALHQLNDELEKKTRCFMERIKTKGSNFDVKCDDLSISSPELSYCSYEENVINDSNLHKSPSFRTLPPSRNQSGTSQKSLPVSRSFKKFAVAKSNLSLGRASSALKASRLILEGCTDSDGIQQSSLSQEAKLRLLNAKSTNLTKEVQQLRSDYSNVAQELKIAQKEIKLLESEKAKSLLQMKTTKDQLRKQEENVEKLTTNLHNRDAENRSLKKQLGTLNQEMKKLKVSYSNQTMKLNQMTLDNERLQAAIKESEFTTKETRDACRKKTDELAGYIKKQTRQIHDLNSLVKKQFELISNLKRQRMIYENNCILKLIKDEFDKILNVANENQSSALSLL